MWSPFFSIVLFSWSLGTPIWYVGSSLLIFLNTVYLCGCVVSKLQHVRSLLFTAVCKTFSCSWNLALWPGIEPRPPALGVQSLSPWTTSEVPLCLSLTISFSLTHFYFEIDFLFSWIFFIPLWCECLSWYFQLSTLQFNLCLWDDVDFFFHFFLDFC